MRYEKNKKPSTRVQTKKRKKFNLFGAELIASFIINLFRRLRYYS